MRFEKHRLKDLEHRVTYLILSGNAKKSKTKNIVIIENNVGLPIFFKYLILKLKHHNMLKI